MGKSSKCDLLTKSSAKYFSFLFYLIPVAIFVLFSIVDEHNIIMEDQFISLRYSRNIAEGAGAVFNVGERVEGFSNPLWVIFMTIPFFFHLNFLAYNRILCALIAIIQFPILNRIIKRYNGDLSPRWLEMVPSLYLALTFPFLFWMKSGLETVLAALFMLLGISFSIRGREGFGSFFFGLLSITRPEGIVFISIPVLSKRLAGLSGQDRIYGLREYFFIILPGAAIFAFYELFRIAYYGKLFPNSFNAKVAPASLYQKIQGLYYYLDWFWWFWLFIFLFSAIACAIDKKYLKETIVIMCAIALNAFFVIAVGGDYMPFARFIVPMMPIFMLLFGLGLLSFHRLLEKTKLMGNQGLIVLALISVATIFHPDLPRHVKAVSYAFRSPHDLPIPPMTLNERMRQFWFTKGGQPNRFVGDWVKNNIPGGAVVATDQCGIIPFISNKRIIDIFGLMTPVMARTPTDKKPEVLLSMNPDYILLAFSFEPAMPTYLPGLFLHNGFREKYCLAKIFSSCGYRPGNPGYILFQRKDLVKNNCYDVFGGGKKDILSIFKQLLDNKRWTSCWNYDDDIFR